MIIAVFAEKAEQDASQQAQQGSFLVGTHGAVAIDQQVSTPSAKLEHGS